MAQGFGANATYQFYRTERWLRRLQAIHNGDHKSAGSFEDLLDYFLAFFLNCYHVKDWLKSGPEWHDGVDREVKSGAVEQFVTESEALCICADLCNGVKHFSLNRPPRSGETLRLKGVHTRIDTSTSPPTKTTRYTLQTERGEVDAYDLAAECVERWRKFILESTPESLLALARQQEARKSGNPCTRKPRPGHA